MERCEECGAILTKDGYCYVCETYRIGNELRDRGERILTADDFKRDKEEEEDYLGDE